MKKIFPVLLTAALILGACKKEDATKDYGFAKVYIPQATVTGIDNSYPIPMGPFGQNSKYTCSYDAASGKLDIALGVIRSGYFAVQKGYSVSLGISADLTAAKVAEVAGVALPAAVCTIPGTITVPDGDSGATVKVSIDLKALAGQSATFKDAEGYKKLVLGLAIPNLQGPSDYSLADSNTSVAIILDLGSEYWTDDVRALFPLD